MVSVTVNLWKALSDLRLRNKIRILWADALCINQSDEKEKSAQVQMMGEIYRKARKAIIHLGSAEDLPDIALAIDLMTQIAGTEYRSWPYIDPSGIWHHRPYSDQDLSEKTLFASNHPSWKALGVLLGRPWFKRAWVR
jgi:hypothetical protein